MNQRENGSDKRRVAWVQLSHTKITRLLAMLRHVEVSLFKKESSIKVNEDFAGRNDLKDFSNSEFQPNI